MGRAGQRIAVPLRLAGSIDRSRLLRRSALGLAGRRRRRGGARAARGIPHLASRGASRLLLGYAPCRSGGMNMPLAIDPSYDVCNAREHGLVGNGTTNDQPALAALVEKLGHACAKD